MCHCFHKHHFIYCFFLLTQMYNDECNFKESFGFWGIFLVTIFLLFYSVNFNSIFQFQTVFHRALVLDLAWRNSIINAESRNFDSNEIFENTSGLLCRFQVVWNEFIFSLFILFILCLSFRYAKVIRSIQHHLQEWQMSAGTVAWSRGSDSDRLWDPVWAAATGPETGATLQRSMDTTGSSWSGRDPPGPDNDTSPEVQVLLFYKYTHSSTRLDPQTKEYAGCSLDGWLVAAVPAPIVADVCCWKTLDLLLGSVAELPPRSSWSRGQIQGPH